MDHVWEIIDKKEGTLAKKRRQRQDVKGKIVVSLGELQNEKAIL